MNGLQLFTHNQFGEIRVIEKGGQPWFVAADVCRALDIGNTAQALTRLDEDEKGVILNDTLGGEQDMSIVSEPGLYSLVLGSRKPEAKAFKRWVTHDILPAIRKHGAYMTPETIEKVLLNPDTIIQLATALKDEQSKNKTLLAVNSDLTVKNQIMAPKADYFDELVDRNLLTNFRETAKQLGAKEKAFIGFLLDRKYIYRDKKGRIMPYAQHVDTGLFEIKETFNEKTQWSGTQTLITPKGRETFRLLMVS